MLITSGISFILSYLFSIACFFSSFSVNFVLSTHQFSIDDLPFVIAVEQDDTSESLYREFDGTEKIKKENQKKPQKKQWKFTESPQLPQNQPKQGYISEMKSKLEQSSSAIQGTSENSKMLKVYLNKEVN